jgi:acetyltransferase EpsM
VPAPESLIVVGGGEHARVVIEAARSRPDLWEVIGFADPSPCLETSERLKLPRVGGDGECLRLAGTCQFILGVGGHRGGPCRRRLVETYERAGTRWATVVHARAWVSESAVLGPGVVVGAGAVVNSGARIGAHGVINTGAIVEHDVELGAFTHVGPGAVIGGGTRVGADTYLGLGCRLRDHIEVGAGVTVGMGAVVVAPVRGGLVVAGVPARPFEGRGHGSVL